MKIVFLDIDGVLNRHEYNLPAQSNSLDVGAVSNLNFVLAETNALLVLTSAWRYLIQSGAMTMDGFDYLLRTHGVVAGRLVGITASDEQIPRRSDQIVDYLKTSDPQTWCVLDDEPDASPRSDRFIKTDGARGLTIEDARQAIAILNT